MQNFCTLFDSFYLNRGLVMYDSLARSGSEFHLFVFAFDDSCFQVLKHMNLPRVTVISLREFESSALLSIKPSRSKGEYCWTCTPYTIEYCLDKFDLKQCTYVDADLCFFGNPKELLDEMGDKSVLITEHRYSPEYDQAKTHGIYCVQFLSIKNDLDGRAVLTWWRDRCFEWCYNRLEDGKFGDQKYLDDWTTRFRGVHVLEHLGGGVAPWNVQQYEILKENEESWMLKEIRSGRKVNLIFYHFHYVKFLKDNQVDISDYKIRGDGVLKLYANYLRKIEATNTKLRKYDYRPPIQPFRNNRQWLIPVERFKRRLKGVYNVFRQDSFIDKWQN